MYRHIVKAHGKFAFQDVSKLNLSEAGKKDYLKMQARQVLNFNTIGAVLVVGSLYVISNTIMDQIRNKNINNVNTTGPQAPKVETSCAKAVSIFMFTFFLYRTIRLNKPRSGRESNKTIKIKTLK